MQEFVKKLIERLEERIKLHNEKAQGYAKSALPTLAIDTLAKRAEVEEIMKIVNQLAEEYKNESVKRDLISRSALIKELNGIYLDNPYDDKEDILEKAIGIVDHFPAPYQPKGE